MNGTIIAGQPPFSPLRDKNADHVADQDIGQAGLDAGSGVGACQPADTKRDARGPAAPAMPAGVAITAMRTPPARRRSQSSQPRAPGRIIPLSW
jgi:hypothetical protein